MLNIVQMAFVKKGSFQVGDVTECYSPSSCAEESCKCVADRWSALMTASFFSLEIKSVPEVKITNFPKIFLFRLR